MSIVIATCKKFSSFANQNNLRNDITNATEESYFLSDVRPNEIASIRKSERKTNKNGTFSTAQHVKTIYPHTHQHHLLIAKSEPPTEKPYHSSSHRPVHSLYK